MYLHCTSWYKKTNHRSIYIPPTKKIHYVTDFLWYVHDILWVPEIYQFVTRLIKWKTRPMNEKEKNIARSFYKDSIDIDVIQIDPTAKFLKKKHVVAYVGFNTINFTTKIKDRVLIHELMHVWQFQHFGSVYISRAISAQRSYPVYDYGGVTNLYKGMLNGKKITDFNFEQQAEIMEDYYVLLSSPQPYNGFYEMVYRYYYEQLFT